MTQLPCTALANQAWRFEDHGQLRTETWQFVAPINAESKRTGSLFTRPLHTCKRTSTLLHFLILNIVTNNRTTHAVKSKKTDLKHFQNWQQPKGVKRERGFRTVVIHRSQHRRQRHTSASVKRSAVSFKFLMTRLQARLRQRQQALDGVA